MVAQHTPFEYDPTDNGTRRVERARLTFKPSEQLTNALLEFVIPSQRERMLGGRGIFLYSNYNWNVYRRPNGSLEPEDALMESDFRKIQMMNDRKMKLTKFVVRKEVRPPELDGHPMLLLGLKVKIDDRQANAIYKNPRIPNKLLSQNYAPVHIAFPEGTAIPSAYRGSAESLLERFVFGAPVMNGDIASGGESPNAQATVSDMQLKFKQKR